MRYLYRIVCIYVWRNLVRKCLFTCYDFFIIATCSSSSQFKARLHDEICAASMTSASAGKYQDAEDVLRWLQRFLGLLRSHRRKDYVHAMLGRCPSSRGLLWWGDSPICSSACYGTAPFVALAFVSRWRSVAQLVFVAALSHACLISSFTSAASRSASQSEQ